MLHVVAGRDRPILIASARVV